MIVLGELPSLFLVDLAQDRNRCSLVSDVATAIEGRCSHELSEHRLRMILSFLLYLLEKKSI